LEFIMQMLPVSVPLLALALCAGCAMDQNSTSAMGAGPTTTASSARTLYCKDGSYVQKSVGCAAGVERDLTPPASTTQK
jgi:hypothetical protein